MFNLGGNDKEKLKENMEEIKDLVNSQEKGSSQGPQELMNGGQNPQQEQGQPPNPDQGPDSQPDNKPQLSPQQDMDNELPSDKQNMGQEMEDLQNAINNQASNEIDRPDTGQNDNAQSRNNNLDSGSDSSNSGFNSSRGLEENNLGSDSSGSSSRDSNSSGNLSGFQSEQRPDLSEESGKPDSEGDTLFLEVDEFNRVQEMVDEMKYLSREMNDLMENLEGGVEEDRRIESEAQDVIDEFSQRREHIESSIN